MSRGPSFGTVSGMAWVLSLLVVVPAVTFFATMTLALSTRRGLSSMPDSFPCKIGVVDAAGHPGIRWPRRASCATWLDNALVITGGLLRNRVRMVNVRVADGMVRRPAGGGPSGLGSQPAFLSLRLVDGTHVVLAAPCNAKSLAAGPYLTALLPGGVDEAAGRQG